MGGQRRGIGCVCCSRVDGSDSRDARHDTSRGWKDGCNDLMMTPDADMLVMLEIYAYLLTHEKAGPHRYTN